MRQKITITVIIDLEDYNNDDKKFLEKDLPFLIAENGGYDAKIEKIEVKEDAHKS